MNWILKFLCQSKTDMIPEEIFIDSLSFRELERFGSNNCCTPNQCFSNCAKAVTNFDLAEKYVLCFVAQVGGRRYGHAIVKLGEKYFDPTLQPQGLSGLRYWMSSEYTKKEVRNLVRENFPKIKAVGGHIEVYPPALKSDGTIVFEEISGPNF
jgi:hypothetical protein